MKPAPFDYHAPRSVDEAVELLAAHGDDAKILAGGQSLVPAMNFRLARPAVLVDINRIAELDFCATSDGVLRIGALARHARFERAGDRRPARHAARRRGALHRPSADPRARHVRRQPRARRPRRRMVRGGGDARCRDPGAWHGWRADDRRRGVLPLDLHDRAAARRADHRGAPAAARAGLALRLCRVQPARGRLRVGHGAGGAAPGRRRASPRRGSGSAAPATGRCGSARPSGPSRARCPAPRRWPKRGAIAAARGRAVRGSARDGRLSARPGPR